MTINDEQKIQISRSKFIEESRQIAVLRLNSKKFLPGEICMLNYYKDPDIKTNIGVLVAIGIKEGVGEDCYRIISVGGFVPVRKISTDLPDVSSLVHGEFYIYNDENNKWNYVYKKENEENRTIVEVTGGPYIFLDIESGYRWFFRDGICTREDDFFSKNSIEDLFQNYVNIEAKLNIHSENGYIFKKGEYKDIILSIEAVNKEGININNSCIFFIDDEQIIVDKYNHYILKQQTEDRTINIVAKYNIGGGIFVPIIGSIEIKFGEIFYYGPVPENWQINISNIKNLLNKKLHYRNDFAWNDINLNQQKTVFCYPSSYGYLNHIFDIHGLDYIHSYQALDKGYRIDNVDYLVYILRESVSINNLKQVYVFNDVDPLNIEEGNLVDVISAWKSRNSFNGLVQLNNSGKVPRELYDINESVFVSLKDIVTEFPKSGMKKGDLYYNKITDEMFLAISSTDGIISNPEPYTLYTFNNTFYSWAGQSLQPIGRISIRKINKIEDLYG